MGESQLTLLAEMLDLIDRYAETVSRTEIERDRETWLKVRGALEVASQCAIDLGLHMVSKHGAGVPERYREVFSLLAKRGLIDAELGAELEGWAGLRYALVHI